MKILMSGGGTGGHITPILALAHELKRLEPECKIVYVGERNGQFQQLTAQSTAIDVEYGVFAGKFRRYHGQSWFKRLLDVPTNLKNLRDIVFVCFGFMQAIRLLGKEKPDLVFLKGGFVGVPVGLAATVRRIPIITHDSDAIPGLANRIVGRWAVLHAVALPSEIYDYPPEKTQTVGVLVEHSYQPVSPAMQAAFKKQLGLPENEPLLLITGGSSGAARINKAAKTIMPELLHELPTLHVIHQVGKGKQGIYENYQDVRLEVIEFMAPMHVYTGAADLIVTRAGANSIAEFGTQGKACVVIPNPDLTAGHQTKNAAILKEQGTAEVLTEDQLYDSQQGLLPTLLRLLNDRETRQQLGKRLQAETINNAAERLAQLIQSKAKS